MIAAGMFLINTLILVAFVAFVGSLGFLMWVVNSQERTEWLSAKIQQWHQRE